MKHIICYVNRKQDKISKYMKIVDVIVTGRIQDNGVNHRKRKEDGTVFYGM